jgi:hypothetical protein
MNTKIEGWTLKLANWCSVLHCKKSFNEQLKSKNLKNAKKLMMKLFKIVFVKPWNEFG